MRHERDQSTFVGALTRDPEGACPCSTAPWKTPLPHGVQAPAETVTITTTNTRQAPTLRLSYLELGVHCGPIRPMLFPC